VESFSLSCSLKSHVFPKVGDPLVCGVFIAATNVKHNAAMNNFGGSDMIMNDTNAVGKSIDFVMPHI
jgi:hypothetical protein